jgi:lipoprotein-releasing system permease protein
LNFPLFIAKKINETKDNKNAISRPIISVAIAGIALGIAVMILSIAIVTGFKKEIRNKVIGFGAHIQILNFDSNKSFETQPIEKDKSYYPFINKLKGVKHMQVYATKAGIIKTKENIQGIVLKGIDAEYDWSFFKTKLIKGEAFSLSDSTTSNNIILSETLAKLLKLDVGDDVAVFFIQQPPRMRRFKITGIYNTSMEEFDKMFVFCDLKHIQRLNNWDNNMISGFEITIDNFDNLDDMTDEIRTIVGYDFFENGSKLKVLNIKDKYPQIFDWLGLMDMNVWIILILMLAVAGVNMISGLLILILERTNMIGILKALGANNFKIRNIFLYQSAFIISKGMFWGNLIGIGICLLQMHFQIIKLDPASYYLDAVPINFNLLHILLLNIGTLIVTIAMLVIPSMIISKISPAIVMRFS